MKLTKGKITKLYNKKRQSFKKPKRRKLSNKRRTFRNKKYLNLHKKSLKRYHYNKTKGGADEDSKEELTTPNLVENVEPVDTSVNIPSEQNIQENTNQITTPITSDGVDQNMTPIVPDNVDQNIEPIVPDNVDQNIEPIANETVDENITPIANETVDENMTHVVPETVDENMTPVVPETIDENVEPIVSETVDENVEPNVENNNEITPVEVPDIFKNHSGEIQNKDELIKSLSQVVDYIRDSVSEKVSENIKSSQFGEKPQDGFQSVNKAVETISKSGGKKKTHRKRLFSKKTRRH